MPTRASRSEKFRPGGLDRDPHLAGAGDGIGPFEDLQDLGRAVLRDDERAHSADPNR